MAGYIGSDKSGVNLDVPNEVTVSSTEPSSPSEGEEGSVALTVTAPAASIRVST